MVTCLIAIDRFRRYSPPKDKQQELLVKHFNLTLKEIYPLIGTAVVAHEKILKEQGNKNNNNASSFHFGNFLNFFNKNNNSSELQPQNDPFSLNSFYRGDVDNTEESLLMKICIIGDVGTGKTTLLMRYMLGKDFDPTKMSPRSFNERDFRIKSIAICGKPYKLQIWDFPLQRFDNFSFARGANIIIITFDIRDKASFSNVKCYLGGINPRASQKPIVLVGTFADKKEQRSVSEEEIYELMETWQQPENCPILGYYEVCANAMEEKNQGPIENIFAEPIYFRQYKQRLQNYIEKETAYDYESNENQKDKEIIKSKRSDVESAKTLSDLKKIVSALRENLTPSGISASHLSKHFGQSNELLRESPEQLKPEPSSGIQSLLSGFGFGK